MFAVVRRYNVKEGMSQRVIERVETEYLEKTKSLAGFVAYYVVDPEDGTLMSLSIFSDRASADESNRKASEFVRERLHGLVGTAPTILTGNVAISA